MNNSKIFIVSFLGISLFLSNSISAQQVKSLNWLTFEQLEDSLKVKPKKVFISFYADWCVYCRKMEKTAFRDKAVVSILNQKYYAVKMNAESKDTISFGGVTYVNQNIGKSRRPTHQISLLLASRKNKPFSLPVNLILNKKFKVTRRYFNYLSPKKLVAALNY